MLYLVIEEEGSDWADASYWIHRAFKSREDAERFAESLRRPGDTCKGYYVREVDLEGTERDELPNK